MSTTIGNAPGEPASAAKASICNACNEILHRTVQQLKEAQRIANIGSWHIDLVSSKLDWSDEIFRIFEIDPEGFGASYEGFLDAIHPDDRAQVDSAFKNAVATHQPYEITHRLLMVRQRLAEPYLIAGHTGHTTASVGIAMFPDDGEDSLLLLKNSNAAMFHAKARGRDAVEFYSKSMTADAEERLALELELQTAIATKQFLLHYQPQMAAASGMLVGYEALVRWQHPQRGLVPPDRFIPIAEECGLVAALGSWVFSEACRQLAAWRASGFALNVRMAVNLSANQLKAPTLVDEVQRTLARHGLSGEDLELEITESVAMRDPSWCVEQLRLLRELGVRLAIDDFGTGYSSLAYLKQLPIHVLKLDRSFVRDIEDNPSGAMISAATISLAHDLGLKVVAEGVETAGQHDYLAARDCDYLQGYRFSKPLPPDQIVFERREDAVAAKKKRPAEAGRTMFERFTESNTEEAVAPNQNFTAMSSSSSMN